LYGRSSKNKFGGGPEIPMFLVDRDNAICNYNIAKEQNFIYNRQYEYGFPDKHPVKIEVTFKAKDADQIKYSLLVSNSLTAKYLLYYIACKLGVDVNKMKIEVEDNQSGGVHEMDSSNDHIDIGEIMMNFYFPTINLFYQGSISDLGRYENEDVYTYFNLHRPITSTNDHNSSTEAVVEDFNDDRDDFDTMMDIDTNIIVEDLNNNGDNDIPPEYRNDPDLWYTIQASLKDFNNQQNPSHNMDSEKEVGISSINNNYEYSIIPPISNIEKATRDFTQDVEMGVEEQK